MVKKIFVVLLIFTMLFNIFVTRSQEFKSKFIVALNCAVNTIESAVFNEYTNKLLKTVNNIMQSLYVVTGEIMVLQNTNKTDNKQHIPVNNSSEEVIITKRISDVNVTINLAKTNLIYFGHTIVRQLNMLYSTIMIDNKEISIIGMLFFILFSIFVVKIKGVIDNKITRNINVIRFRLA